MINDDSIEDWIFRTNFTTLPTESLPFIPRESLPLAGYLYHRGAFHRFNITDLFFSSQGLAQKFYSVRGSCQSVKDRLGRGRLVNELIPFIDR